MFNHTHPPKALTSAIIYSYQYVQNIIVHFDKQDIKTKQQYEKIQNASSIRQWQKRESIFRTASINFRFKDKGKVRFIFHFIMKETAVYSELSSHYSLSCFPQWLPRQTNGGSMFNISILLLLYSIIIHSCPGRHLFCFGILTYELWQRVYNHKMSYQSHIIIRFAFDLYV